MEYESELATLIEKLDEQAVQALVKARLEAGDDPLRIVDEAEYGMRRVGKLYEEGKYFIAALIMAGEIFHQVMAQVQPQIEACFEGVASGRVLLGTVQGDIHDLGKNILSMLLRCHGFTVYDLEVDVAPAEFAARTSELRPDIVGLSGLLTSSYNSMRETVALLRRETGAWRPPPALIIGGNQLDQAVVEYVKADYWTNEAIEGVRLCQRIMAERQNLAH